MSSDFGKHFGLLSKVAFINEYAELAVIIVSSKNKLSAYNLPTDAAMQYLFQTIQIKLMFSLSQS